MQRLTFDTATWSELSAGAELIEGLDPDEAALERKFVADEMGEMLCDPDLTLYTAPQHMVASYETVDGFHQAYRLSSGAAYIALNLDDGHFKALRPPTDMQVWGDRNAAWRKNRDPAFAFAAIAIAAGTYFVGQSTEDWLNEGLSRCRLPEAARIRATALGKMEREVDGGAGAQDEALRAQLNAGLEAARARSQTDDQALVFSRSKAQKLPLPPDGRSRAGSVPLPLQHFRLCEVRPSRNAQAPVASGKGDRQLALCLSLGCPRTCWARLNLKPGTGAWRTVELAVRTAPAQTVYPFDRRWPAGGDLVERIVLPVVGCSAPARRVAPSCAEGARL